jgi:hypothetical protein
MNIKKRLILASILAVMTAASGCGHLETYGEKISSRNIVALKNIVMHPQDYDGKTVTVKGKIKLVCETGCWFNLEDGGAVIYTDLAPSGFAIPQKVGRNATVEGKISIESGKLVLTAKGVEIR